MDVLWPWSLLLLGMIPLLVGLYIWTLRRRRRFAVRYSSLSLVRAALPRYSRWRRHLPFALLLAALASLIVALGRPVAVAAIPTSQATIMLALDVSRSMCSTDIQPNPAIYIVLARQRGGRQPGEGPARQVEHVGHGGRVDDAVHASRAHKAQG